MVFPSQRISGLAVSLIVGLVLLGWPRVGFAQGTWSVISLPQKPGELLSLRALAVDTGGTLYIAGSQANQDGLIQKRDVEGNWSVIATRGLALGQVYFPSALAVDTSDNLYVADDGGIQKRDAQGNWSKLTTRSDDPDQDYFPMALAVDTAGNLYVAEEPNSSAQRSRIQKRDSQGRWSAIAMGGNALGQVGNPTALAVDTGGNLYVADWGEDGGRIQKRDPQGNWSVIATPGDALGQVRNQATLAIDTTGSLYVVDWEYPRIQKRDVQGNWSVIAAAGTGVGQIANFEAFASAALAVDTAGNLYVADNINTRVQMYTPGP